MISLIIKDFNDFSEIISSKDLQLIYNRQLSKVDYLSFKCSRCNKSNWHIHAYYKRKLIFYGYTYKLSLIRVKCSTCNTTHVILPYFIIPYQRVFLLDLFLDCKDKINCLKSFINSKARHIALIFLFPT